MNTQDSHRKNHSKNGGRKKTEHRSKQRTGGSKSRSQNHSRDRSGNSKSNSREAIPTQTTYEGSISVNNRGVGYLRTDRLEEDIEIPQEGMNTALNGDTVQVNLLSQRSDRDRIQGEVSEVLERNRTEFVGTLKKNNGTAVCEADDPRMYRDIYLNKDEVRDIETGTKIFVRIGDWTDPKQNPEGTLLQTLGKQGEHDVEMNSIVLEHGFRTEFPHAVQKEAEEIQQRSRENIQNEIPNRRDFRGVTTMTIDPWDAKDFDDGLSYKKLENGNVEIGIHIADVSHYVTPGSELDKEALKRGFSVYLVDRTIPMLPEELSNDVCSLNPEEDKLAFSAVFELDHSGNIQDRWFGRTIINSDKRFTYEEAQKNIDTGEGAFPAELKVMNEIAQKLGEKRFKEGAVDFETDEVEIELDENMQPKKIYKKERIDTQKLIEEYMLLANREVARHIAKKQEKGHGSFLYRVHDQPDPEKIDSLTIFTDALGYDLERLGNGSITSQALNSLMKKIEGEPSEDLIKVAAIKSMAKAVYSTKNIGHFGLAFEYYTHFTSPIRRYPDLAVHRILGKYVAGEKISSEEFAQLKVVAERSAQQELDAMHAERDSIKYKQVEYMADHVGETFTGVISGISPNGIFIAEESTGAEGMVRMRDLGSDYFELDDSNFAIVGKRTGTKFQLGDEVTFTITNANLELKQLDYKLVPKESPKKQA
ncbi:MAG: ribonuclease R [Candidatus Paceibacterota bacterium]